MILPLFGLLFIKVEESINVTEAEGAKGAKKRKITPIKAIDGGEGEFSVLNSARKLIAEYRVF